MNYEKIEDVIVGRLTMPGVSVSALPHISALNEARPVTKPQLFVLVNGGSFSDRENLSVVSQLEDIQVEIFMRAKNRRGKLGIFALYEECSRLLLGFKVPGAKEAITFNQFGYVAGIQNTWQYALIVSFSAYRMEAEDKEPYDTTIKKITTNIKP